MLYFGSLLSQIYQCVVLFSSHVRNRIFTGLSMGNKPAKQEKKEELMLKIMPPLDRAYTHWLAKDLARVHGFTPRNPRAIKPPDHYIEHMRMNGWLDLDLDDPDLAHLFK